MVDMGNDGEITCEFRGHFLKLISHLSFVDWALLD